jgi:2-polyprenyl-3-methyl-5-hydroxy-6-metoxy-1,4-benzoquinol methylase
MYDKSPDYFSQCRMDMLGAIPAGGKARILEIGAGNGETLIKAKALGLAEEVVGMELMELDPVRQFHPTIDTFLLGDVERIDLPFEPGYFDVILCGDVLEHLVDPWRTVARLAVHLKEGGHIIVSLPNVREIKTLLKVMINGSFAYSDTGILDRTHLRFFCRRDMMALLEQNGLSIIDVKSNLDLLGKGKRAFLNKVTAGVFAEFLEGEYLLVARKTS